MARVGITILEDAFNAAFGLKPRRFSIPGKPEKQGAIHSFPDISSSSDLLEINEAVKTSLLGTPILDSIVVSAGTTPKGIKYNQFTFGIDPLIEVNRRKNIVETKIAGRDGTVKELIGKEDWQVKIRGLLVGSTGLYPEDEVTELYNLVELDASLVVSSKFLNLFNIHNLVIQDYSFPMLQGFPDTQPYEITATSDTPIELEFKD